MARCQYAWSANTVAKLPMTLITPKTSPGTECIVRYEPPAFPITGLVSAAFTKSSCMCVGDPIFGDVAYTVNTKVKMIAKRIVVCVLSDVEKGYRKMCELTY